MDSFGQWLEKRTMLESGYARVRRIMFGDVPSIRTMGIVTAQNPNGREPWPGNDIESGRENRDLNRSLEEYLRIRNLGPIKVKGKFGLKEDSFLIPNITREELVNIGRWFDQQAVIWGEKGLDHYKNPFFWFEYIDTASGQTKGTRSVHIGSSDVQGRDDYYTMIGGRKFVIPFFDDPHSHKVPGKKYGTVADVPETPATPWTADELAAKIRKAETFGIPFFDDPTSDLDGQRKEITYFSSRLPDDPTVYKLVEDIQVNAEALFAEQCHEGAAKSYWHHRGMILEAMAKLDNF